MTVIQNARTNGYSAGKAFVNEHGYDEAKVYAKQLGDDYPAPSPAMYGYIDGFMNAVADGKPWA